MELKKLFTLALLTIGISAQAANTTFNSFDPSYFGNSNNITITKLWRELGTNVLIIDNAIGDDTKAAADPYRKPWKTAYNITSTNAAAHGAYGACTVAQPGDWIVFMNSTVPYLVPCIPLNLFGQGASNGFNLMIMPGATLIATNYSNTDGTGTYHCNLATSGPMIIPGNSSRVDIYGTLVNNNDFVQGAASIGWQVNGSTSLAFTGVTNIPATNFYVWMGGSGHIGNGGDADCVYIGNGQAFAGSGTFENVRTSSGWDSFFFTGATLTITNINCYAYSGDFPTNGISHGLSVTSGTLYDFGSTYIGTGSTNVNGTVSGSAGVAIFGSAKVFLRGTKALAVGNANIVPVFYNSTPVFGSWSETDTNAITALFSQTYKFGETVTTVDTNFLVLSGAGQGGPGNVNLQYKWDFTGTVFSNSATHFVTNSDGVPGPTTGIWRVLGGAQYRYISLTGFLGPYAITNASTAPAPNADYLRTTNFNVSALGDIAQSNFVSGVKYTNVIGRPISVRALGFYVPASVAGLAAMDLQVDQTQSGTFSIMSRVGEQTIVGSIVDTNYGDMSAFIMTNAVYVFTNASSGAGNSSGLIPGSGQTIVH